MIQHSMLAVVTKPGHVANGVHKTLFVLCVQYHKSGPVGGILNSQHQESRGGDSHLF